MNIRCRSITLVLALAALSLCSSRAGALVIYASYGGNFGSSAYQSVAEAATSTWQSLGNAWWPRVANYPFNVTITTLDLGAAGAPYALTLANTQGTAANAATGTYLWTGATIAFNSNPDVWPLFFWDTTPADNAEFAMDPAKNAGLYGTATAADAVGKVDAYSVLLHEFGHAFGFMGFTGSNVFNGTAYNWYQYDSFRDNLSADLSTFTFDYLPALQGTQVAMGYINNIDFQGYDPYHIRAALNPYDSMRVTELGASGPQKGERILISTLDLNVIADAFHLVAEPGTLALVVLGLLAVVRSRVVTARVR